MVRGSKYRNSHVGNGCIFWKKQANWWIPSSSFSSFEHISFFLFPNIYIPYKPESSLRELEANLGVP